MEHLLKLSPQALAKSTVSPSQRHRQAVSTNTYLDQHGLLPFIQDLLTGFTNEQPSDPWAYIERCTKEAKALQAKKLAAEPPNEQESVSAETLRQQARDALVKGVQSGQLFAAVAQTRATRNAECATTDTSVELPNEQELVSLETLRQQARDALLQGNRNGQLFATVAQVRAKREAASVTSDISLEDLKVRARSAIMCALGVDQEEKDVDESVAESCESAETLACQVRSTLIQASLNGELAKALQEALAEAKEATEATAAAEEKDETASLSAAFAAKDARGDERDVADIEEIKAQARSGLAAFMEAPEGANDVEESAAEGCASAETLACQARSTLIQASLNGELAKALQEASAEANESAAARAAAARAERDIEALKAEAQETLLTAALTGTLRDAVTSVRAEQEELDALRRQVSETFTEANRKGELMDAIAQVSAQAAAAASEAAQVEALRIEAKAQLLSAQKCGELHAAFATVKAARAQAKEKREVEKFREKTRRTLLQAVSTGELAKALQELAPRSAPPAATVKAPIAQVVDATHVDEEADAAEALRLQLKDMFVHASTKAELLPALQHAHTAEKPSETEPDIEALRADVKFTMMSALAAESSIAPASADIPKQEPKVAAPAALPAKVKAAPTPVDGTKLSRSQGVSMPAMHLDLDIDAARTGSAKQRHAHFAPSSGLLVPGPVSPKTLPSLKTEGQWAAQACPLQGPSLAELEAKLLGRTQKSQCEGMDNLWRTGARLKRNRSAGAVGKVGHKIKDLSGARQRSLEMLHACGGV